MYTISEKMQWYDGGCILRNKLIAAGMLWVGISAVATSAFAQVTKEQLNEALNAAVNTLSAQIQGVRGDLQTRVDTLEGRLDQHIRERHPRPTEGHPHPPSTRVVHVHRHYYQYWCPPPWWEPW